MLAHRWGQHVPVWATSCMNQFIHPTSSWKGNCWAKWFHLLGGSLKNTNRHVTIFSNFGNNSHVTNRSYQLVRTCALILLTTALGGAWSLEQPSGSLLEFYPTWRFIMMMICNISGPSAVIALHALWMKALSINCMQNHCVFDQTGTERKF